MGAFATYLQSIKAAQNGVTPIGGTFFPTNEGFPIIPGLSVAGGSFPLPDIATLVDIPYDILVLNMEVRVVNGDGMGNSVKYYLVQLPPVDTRVNQVPGFDYTDYWTIVEDGGGVPEPGPPGDKGWSMQVATETDGPNRTVLKVTGWIGGGGTPPATPAAPNNYIGPSGYTSKSLASNIKGNPGDPATSRPQAYFSVGSKCITPPSQVWTTGNWNFVTETLRVDNLFNADRWFVLRGEVPVANDSGSDSWGVRLNMRGDDSWGPPASQPVMDENYSRMDFVSSNGNNGVSSVHKIPVGCSILIPANSSRFFRLTFRQTAGGGSRYEDGFIEAFGI